MPSPPSQTTPANVCPRCHAAYDEPLRFCGLCGSDMRGDAPAGEPADGWLGKIVDGRYRVLAHIGQGGMGAVYKVEHVRMGKLAAMKVLHHELAGDRDAIKRFKREAEAVSKLSHPHTVQVFDFGDWEGAFYIVMELLRGEDLSSIVKRDGPLPFARAAAILVQVCGALGEAHELGIVHRDLKPENIIVSKTREGQDFVKVLDFGLAKFREREELSEVTSRGTILGTPYYMSPEQIRAESLDHRSDIYSLGAVAYRILTGEPPFTAQTPVGVLTKHLMDPVVPPSRLRPDLALDPKIDALCLRALAKKREERYQTIDALRADLETVGRDLGLPGAAQPQDRRAADATPGSLVAERSMLEAARAEPRSASAGAGRMRREDYDAFERQLKRGRWIRLSLLPMLLIAGSVGAYLVKERLAGPADFEQEPNNDPATANALGDGRPIQGAMGRRIDTETSDRDYFHFTVPANAPPQLLSVSLTGVADIDLVLEVYDGGGHRVGYADENGAGYREVLPNLGLTAGEYYLDVREVLIPGRPAVEDLEDFYTLTARWRARAPAEEVEPDDSPAQALSAPLGQPIIGYLGRRNDVDWYLPDGAGGGQLSGTVSGVQGVDMRVRVVMRASGAAPEKVIDAQPLALSAPARPSSSGSGGAPASQRAKLPEGEVFDSGGVAEGESFAVAWAAGAPAPYVVIERKDPKPDASGYHGEALGLDAPYTLELRLAGR